MPLGVGVDCDWTGCSGATGRRIELRETLVQPIGMEVFQRGEADIEGASELGKIERHARLYPRDRRVDAVAIDAQGPSGAKSAPAPAATIAAAPPREIP